MAGCEVLHNFVKLLILVIFVNRSLLQLCEKVDFIFFTFDLN